MNSQEHFSSPKVLETNIIFQNAKRIDAASLKDGFVEIVLITAREMIHARYSSESSQCILVSTTAIDTPKIYARIDLKGRLHTVDKATNNLTISNFFEGKVIKKYPGNTEEPYRKFFSVDLTFKASMSLDL